MHYVFVLFKETTKQNLFLKADWENFKVGCITNQKKITFMFKKN